jgi:hypothetical protein
LDSAVPIRVKTVTIAFADVSTKNLSGELAQFFSSVEVGSPFVARCRRAAAV